MAKCFIDAFSTFGFPNEILSDQGTEFVSQIMEVFLKECNVLKLLFTTQKLMDLLRDFADV